jgi:iron complex transport system ATP-binding protein
MNLEIEAISVAGPTRPILDRVSLTLRPGELVGLVGPNGAGKSTLLRVAVGVQKQDAGRVLLDGRPISRMSGRQRARALAYLPQDRRIEWPLTSRSVVTLGRYPHHNGFSPPAESSMRAVDKAMHAVDADVLADRNVTVLSGGERTRVLLARALAVEAPLLLADEPVAGLDPYHQLHVMEILRDTARLGTGVLAVLHDLSLAMRYPDRLVLLCEGEVIADGPPRDVLTRRNLEQAYRISAVHGTVGNLDYLLPWSRLT